MSAIHLIDEPEAQQGSSLNELDSTPGTNGIVEITLQVLSTDAPHEYVTNTFAVNSGTSSATLANWQALTDAILGVWKVSPGVHWGYAGCAITVNAYDRADAKPRPEKGHSHYTPTTWNTDTTQARQVALCVSFYSARNLKRDRGRVYLIPLNNVGAAERPGSSQRAGALGLITATSTAITSLVPVWNLAVYSKADGATKVLTNCWCNDVWDTQRRRAPKETTRTLGTLP